MLADLDAAIARGDVSAALVEALRLWREHRFPQLAELVRILGARVLRPSPRVGSTSHGWWVEVARATDPADVTRLIERIDDNYNARGLLLGSSAHPLAREVSAWLSTYPHAMRHDAWLDRLLCALAWPDDPRWLPLLERWRDQRRELRVWQESRTLELSALCRPYIDERRAALSRSVEPPAELMPALAALIVAATPVTTRHPGDEARLWAAVAAAPRDLAPRQVLADYLIGHGDPRGRLIAFQLADPAYFASKILRLIQAHRRDWLGAVDTLVLERDAVWRDGMLDACRIGSTRTTDEAYAAAPTHRELACVRTLVGAQAPATHYAALLDAMPQVERIGVHDPEVPAALAARRTRWPYRLVELGARDAARNRRGWPAACLPALAQVCPDVETLILLPRNRRNIDNATGLAEALAPARALFPRLATLWAPRDEVELAGLADFYDEVP